MEFTFITEKTTLMKWLFWILMLILSGNNAQSFVKLKLVYMSNKVLKIKETKIIAEEIQI